MKAMAWKTAWTTEWMTAWMLTGVIAVGAGGCGGGKTTNTQTGAVTFWKDVAPIYNEKCVRCHQEGGIAPFRLDNYADAAKFAVLELARTQEGTMPPYFMVHDGSCGSFHDEMTLAASEKATIAAWVNGSREEGTPVTLALPPRPALTGAVDVSTPMFSPVAQGGQLAEFDEYRCFLLNTPLTADAFLTGYDVTPGDATIVHHILGFVVDPQRAGSGGLTNAAIMKALDDQSPDRLGWPCFGAAGEGVSVSGVPISWAPGQGIVEYPTGMGMPLRPTDKLVVQVHYNLAPADSGQPAVAGKTDSTGIHLRFASSVSRRLAFLLPDPFLDSLENASPDTLPPRLSNTAYTWTKTGREIGVNLAIGVDLVAVMPHMHGRGVRQKLTLGSACAARLENWDFHWQKFYFYKTYPRILPTTPVQLTCEYNTLGDVQAVLPGWGTRNEMCLAVLMVASPQ